MRGDIERSAGRYTESLRHERGSDEANRLATAAFGAAAAYDIDRRLEGARRAMRLFLVAYMGLAQSSWTFMGGAWS